LHSARSRTWPGGFQSYGELSNVIIEKAAAEDQLLTLPFIASYIVFRQPALLYQLDPRSRPSQHKESIADEPETPVVRNPALAARLIWLRSFLTSAELCLMYAALSRIPLSEFVSVFMTRAFLIGFLCWILLKEVFGWRLQLAAGVSFRALRWRPELIAGISTIAVALIVQPPFLFGDPVSGDAGTRVSGCLLCLACLIVDTLESEQIAPMLRVPLIHFSGRLTRYRCRPQSLDHDARVCDHLCPGWSMVSF
jgi:drug/metabolite transporter (DMT)-like permease